MTTKPDVTNAQRADWARKALMTHKAIVGNMAAEPITEEDLSDILCDLMHFADLFQIDFQAAAENAISNHLAETEEAA